MFILQPQHTDPHNICEGITYLATCIKSMLCKNKNICEGVVTNALQSCSEELLFLTSQSWDRCTSNTTTVFLQGDHTLDTNITVANVDRLTMCGESSSGNMATIVCSGSVGLSFTRMVDLKIDSLAFTSCNTKYAASLGIVYMALVLHNMLNWLPVHLMTAIMKRRLSVTNLSSENNLPTSILALHLK